MKFLKELIIIISLFLLGELIATWCAVPFFGSILGMLFLIIFLLINIFKDTDIEKMHNFLNENMSFFFLPLAVEIIIIFELIKEDILVILFIIIIATITTFFATYYSAMFLLKIIYRREDKNGKLDK